MNQQNKLSSFSVHYKLHWNEELQHGKEETSYEAHGPIGA